jgi:hypothetical protein
VPLVLALWAVTDLALRLLPPQWFRVNALIIALRSPGWSTSFTPSLSLHYEYIGDAVREGNLRPTERRPPVRFSTDELGYRLNPFLPDGHEADLIVLRGFSFVYGGALSDAETLPAALTRLGGIRAYNAARWHLDPYDSLPSFDWLLSELPVRPRRAVLVYLEHEDPRRPRFDEPGIVGYAAGIHPALVEPLTMLRTQYRLVQTLRRLARRWWDFSPLEILTTRLDRRLRNGRLLPNAREGQVRALPMPDGRRMVFRAYELKSSQRLRSRADARATVDYLAWWRAALASRGLETVVLTLPTRYSVYGPHLETGEARARALQSRAYLRYVNDELDARGIRYVDGSAVFFSRAEDELRTGRLSFYREDNHWNASGVERAARPLIEELGSASRRDQRTRARTGTSP